MVEVTLALALFGGIIVLGFLAEQIFRLTKIPDVLILIIVGMILGQIYPLTGSPFEALAPLFTTFALVLILFEGALRLNISNLIKQLGKSAILSIAGFGLSVGVVFLIAKLFGLTSSVSLLLGFIVAGTSSAVVIPMIKHLQLSKETSAILTIESAFTDVLCIVTTVIATQAIILKSVSPGEVLSALTVNLLLALAVGSAVGLVWVLGVRKWSIINSHVLTISVVVLLYAVVETLGANGAVASLAFGLVLGNAKDVPKTIVEQEDETEARVEVKRKSLLKQHHLTVYAEVSFFVKTFFFVYLGTLMDLTNFWPVIVAITLTVGLFAVRPLAVLLSRAGNDKEKPVIEAMFPKGLAAAVLASVPIQAGIAGSETLPSIVLSVVFFSIVSCSIVVFAIQQGWFYGLYRRPTPKNSSKEVVKQKKK